MLFLSSRVGSKVHGEELMGPELQVAGHIDATAEGKGAPDAGRSHDGPMRARFLVRLGGASAESVGAVAPRLGFADLGENGADSSIKVSPADMGEQQGARGDAAPNEWPKDTHRTDRSGPRVCQRAEEGKTQGAARSQIPPKENFVTSTGTPSWPRTPMGAFSGIGGKSPIMSDVKARLNINVSDGGPPGG